MSKLDTKSTWTRERSVELKRLQEGLRRWGTDLALVLGGAAIAAGAALIYLPAGLIAAGVLTIAGAVISSMGGGGEG